MRISVRRAAEIAIMIQFLALLRTLGEMHVLRGPGFALDDALPYLTGGVIAALGTWLAVGCYMWNRYRAAIAIVGGTIIVMLGYKFIFLA
jgi:uncharacterized membrane protein YedE/YeeE